MDVARAAAAEERASKRYNNRTHKLIKSTQALLLEASANQATVELAMDTEYASYVHDKFGLSDFRDIGDDVIVEMAEVLDDIF
jgi:hypothetical protein